MFTLFAVARLQMIKVRIQNWIEERDAKAKEARRTQAHLNKVKAELEATEKERLMEQVKVSNISRS